MNINGGAMLKNNRFKNLILFVMFAFIISIYIFDRGITDFDELWNFNFALNISNGLVPYRDFNILQTPLMPFISGIILKILGRELLVMRLLGVVLSTCIIFMSYRILQKLKVNSTYSIGVSLFLIYVYKNYFTIDYNFMNLLLILIIIYLELKNKDVDRFLYSFGLGVILGLTILTKQSTGLVISFIACGYRLLVVRNKDSLLKFIKTAIARVFGICIPMLTFIIYLIATNAYHDFIDYAILGINTFSNSIKYSSLLDNEKIIAVSSIVVPIIIIVELIYSAFTSNKEKIILSSYAIGSLILVYPIADSIHFLIGAMPGFLLVLYLLFEVLSRIYNEEKDSNKETLIASKIVNELILFAFVFLSLYNAYRTFEKLFNEKNYQSLAHFRGIYMDDHEISEIENVDKFILNDKENTIMLDAYASIYMIPIDKYDKDFSLFLKGNLGSRGEDGIISKIQVLNSGTKFLIRKDGYRRNWQTPENVISYVKKEYKKIDEIEIFDIYEKEE